VEGIAYTGEIGNEYEVLVGNLDGRKILGKNRCRWQNNIKMYSKEIGWTYMDWIHLVCGRIAELLRTR
jgi:hypothetical protein